LLSLCSSGRINFFSLSHFFRSLASKRNEKSKKQAEKQHKRERIELKQKRAASSSKEQQFSREAIEPLEVTTALSLMALSRDYEAMK
jgi:hypothetical protein